MLFGDRIEFLRLVLDVVLDDQLRHIGAGVGDIVVAAALARVDLERLVLAVARIVFDVKIGEADKADLLEQRAELLLHLFIVLGDDARVVADAVRGVLLEQHVAEAHHADLAVLAGIAGQNAHRAVVARDELLDDERVIVARRVDVDQDVLELLVILGDVDLLLAFERMLPVLDAAGRLDDVRRLERQLDVDAHVLAVDERLRIIHAHLFAQLIKLLLVDEAVHQLHVDVRRHDVLRKVVLVSGRELHVAVAAAHQDDGLVLVRPGKVTHQLVEYLRHVRLLVGRVVDDLAVHAGAGREFAVAVRCDAVRFVECSGYAVYIDVARKKQGLESLVLIAVHRSFFSFLTYCKRALTARKSLLSHSCLS